MATWQLFASKHGVTHFCIVQYYIESTVIVIVSALNDDFVRSYRRI